MNNSLLTTHPDVTVIIPCYNEAPYIARCLDSLLGGDYPGVLSVLVVDGGSTDGSRDIVASLCTRDDRVRLLDNVKRTAPAALNIGIKRAGDEILIRVDAHAVYKPEYISRCVAALLKYSPDNLGGVCKTVAGVPTLVGKAIAFSRSHWLGIGNAAFRLATATQPTWVDTVPFFCCRKDLFDRVGLFNEDLTRTQDIEFNRRIARAGGRILLCPDIEVTYFATPCLTAFARHYWKTGFWVILQFAYSDVLAVSWRHMVPLAFVLSLLATGLVGLFLPGFAAVSALILGLYFCAVTGVSLQIALAERDWRYAIIMPLTFGVLHVSYGVGSLCGMGKLMQVWPAVQKRARA